MVDISTVATDRSRWRSQRPSGVCSAIRTTFRIRWVGASTKARLASDKSASSG